MQKLTFGMIGLLAAFFIPFSVIAAQKDVYFQTSDGVKLHYIEAGQGETIVFVPGWTMPADIWEKQIAHFARFAHVVAFDPRSQGLSDVAPTGHEPQRRGQDIKELIDQLKVPQVVLVAWSLGVLEALSYVQQFGDDQLSAVVFVDNSVGENPPPGGVNPMPEIRKNRERGTELFVRSMYKTKQSDSYLARIATASLKTPYEASLLLLNTLYARDVWRKIFYTITKPILFVVTPDVEGQAHTIKRKKPEVWVEIYKNAGHALFVDESARFNSLLEKFLKKKVWKK